MFSVRNVLLAGFALLLIGTAGRAQSGFGSIQTTGVTGTQTNQNVYAGLSDVYLSGGGGGGGNILAEGYYAYAVTDTSGKNLVTTIGSFFRTSAQGNQQKAFFNVLSGQPSPYASAGNQGGSGTTQVHAPTPNGVYRLIVWQLSPAYTKTRPSTPTTLDALTGYGKKSDNVRINAQTPTDAIPEPGSMALIAMGALPVIPFLRRRK